MKKTLVTAIVALTLGTAASAEQFQLGGQVHNVELATLCGSDGQTYSGHEIHVWPDGQLWIGQRRGEIAKFSDVCPKVRRVTNYGRDGFQNDWANSDLVDADGNVNIGANETVIEHGSTDDSDSGFTGGGPPSIDS